MQATERRKRNARAYADSATCLLSDLLEPFFAAKTLRKNFRAVLRNAEKYVEGRR